MSDRFWYSGKQAAVILNPNPIFGEPKTILPTARISVAGEMVEVPYTESSTKADYWPNWDDTAYLGEGEVWTVDGSREKALHCLREIERLAPIFEQLFGKGSAE